MAAKYDLYENPDPKQSGEKQALHARFVPTGKTSVTHLCERAANGNTFNPGEMKAMLECIIDRVVEELGMGYVVELGSLGTVSMTLESRPVMEKNEIRSASVRVKNLTLTVSKKMKRRIKGIALERNPYGWQSHKISEDEIELRMTKFFAGNLVMRSSDYCCLRECKRCKGIEELNAFIAAGKLERSGHGSTTVYFPAKGNFGR